MTAPSPDGVVQFYERHLREGPDRVAVSTENGGALSYGEIWSLARKVQGWLADVGVVPGDRVAIALDNEVHTPAALLGTFLAHACAVPMAEDGRDPAFILGDAGCRAALVSRVPGPVASVMGEQATLAMERVCGLEPAASGTGAPAADELALLIYTSGSTGQPRGVVCHHGQVAHAIAGMQQRLKYRADDVVYCCLPPSFDYGLYQYFLSAAAGARVLGADGAGILSVVGTLARNGVTVLPAVPTLLVSMVKSRMLERIELPQLRLLTSTGDTFPPSLIERIQSLLPQVSITAMYGLTECKRVSILTAEERRQRPGSVGRALDTLTASVVDGDGQPLPPGSEGELVIRGPHVMSGYWHRPEETARRFLGDTLFTGDRFVIDEEGYLYFCGRMSSFIKCNGVMVSPSEVEKVLSSLDGVDHAAVVGLPDSARGQKVAAVLSCPAGMAPSLGRVQSHCRALLPSEAIPLSMRIVSALPRTPNGKIDRVAASTLFDEDRAP